MDDTTQQMVADRQNLAASLRSAMDAFSSMQSGAAHATTALHLFGAARPNLRRITGTAQSAEKRAELRRARELVKQPHGHA